jgi:outer membrane protein assembly factor BamB
MKALLCAAALLLCAVVQTRGENWPRFRGPTGQGHSTERNLPIEWSLNQNVAWKSGVPGDGWSSPIVWGERVFVTSATDGGTKCHVICLDAKSGKILWDSVPFEQIPRRKEGKNSYATPTPVTDGNAVYATFGDGSVAALSFTGNVLWTNRDVRFYSRHGLGSSPILQSGLFIQSYDGTQPVEKPGNYPQVTDDERTGWQIPWDKSFIAALDVKTGKRVWTGKRGLSRVGHVTPIVLEIDGMQQIVSGAGDRMQGFDPKTGELLWGVYQEGEGVVPSPVVAQDILVTASGYDKSGKTTLRGLKLGGGRGDVTSTHIRWEQKRGAPTLSSPLYVHPHLYTVTDAGMLSCIKPADGEILWQERLGGSFSTSPVYADGRIYALSETAETVVIAPGAEFKILARNKLEGRVQASLAVSGEALFIRTAQHVYCIRK